MSKKQCMSAWEENCKVVSLNGHAPGISDSCDAPITPAKQGGCWPQDVGIIAMEIYFPSQFVDQTELEEFDGASKGKYTIGLGQTRLGFCSDREDINSLCLTVLTQLVEKTGIGYQSIGRLEVGTETIIDKSKSVKSVLMSAFAASGNSDVEGVDSTNACYGGTAALINAVNWVESSSWDGRYAVAVAGDIAIYASGAARPTSGAGAVAMLVGPNAPLVLDRGVRSSYMTHSYDFYKPVLSSEYPVVDGKLSIQCYFSALDSCYAAYLSKARCRLEEKVTGLESFKAVLFHAPYCKLVQKSFARLAYNDFRNLSAETAAAVHPDLMAFRFVLACNSRYDFRVAVHPGLMVFRFVLACNSRYAFRVAVHPGLMAFRDRPLDQTYFDKDIEKAFMTVSQRAFLSKTRPSLMLATEVGNMYTPSVYGALASFLSNYSENPESLIGERLCLFSFGSGLASTMYSLVIKEGTAPAAVSGSSCPQRLSSGLTQLVASLSDLQERLESRTKVSPKVFSESLQLRETTHHLAPYTPTGSIDQLYPGTWYLTGVDDKHRRQYDRRPVHTPTPTPAAAALKVAGVAAKEVPQIRIPAAIKS
ncbi:Hydroxymethylglutaryl-CoA synthase eukaryotic [Trinorchestia longiramus]|nr:Hydroxymethylglutaryl-CoA synthase eukaryotic [Trinorchestia longiramus]